MSIAKIPTILKDMREHAEEIIRDDEKKGANGLLITEGVILKMYVEEQKNV